MANTITLPSALSRSPYDHLTIRNGSTSETLTISADGTDLIESTAGGVSSISIYPMASVTLQSNGLDSWARIHDFKLQTEIEERELADNLSIDDTVWYPITGFSWTNTRASGIYLFTGYFSCEVTAGNNVNVGFQVRGVLNGTPLEPLETWQDRASSVKLTISVATPIIFSVGDVLTIEAQQIPGTDGSYTLQGSTGGGDYTTSEITGPL